MDKRRDGSKDLFASGLLRGAVATGLVSGLAAAASLSGAGTANASCLSIGGFFSIGSGCTSTPLSFALVLGTGQANAQGLLTGAFAIGNGTFVDARGFLTAAIANGVGNTVPGPPQTPPQTDVRSEGALSLAYGGGTNTIVRTEGNLAIAAAQGNGYIARAGQFPTDIGNVALGIGNNFNPDPNELSPVVAGSIAPNGPPSYFNLAVNLGSTNNVQANGFLNSVFNIGGDENAVSAIGILNNGTNVFGNGNEVIAANDPDPAANILQQIGGNVAFNGFGDVNIVHAGTQIGPPPGGPLAIAGALGVDNQSVDQPGTGITIATPFNSTGSNNNVLAAGGTQRSLVRPSLNAAPNRPNATSPGRSTLQSVSDRITTSANKFSPQGSLIGPSLNATPNHPEATSPTGSVLKSVSDRITTTAKKFRDTVSRGTGGHAGGAEAGAASTSSSDK